MGEDNIGYYADSNMLFNEVIRQKKSIEDWPNFVMKELNKNPRSWIEPRRCSRLAWVQRLA